MTPDLGGIRVITRAMSLPNRASVINQRRGSCGFRGGWHGSMGFDYSAGR